jgi:hypothetical protein
VRVGHDGSDGGRHVVVRLRFKRLDRTDPF